MSTITNPNYKIRIVDTFDGMGELLDYIEKAPIAWENGGSNAHGDRNDFNGTKTFADAVELAKHGWPEGRNKMSTELEATVKLVNPYRAEQNYLDIGGIYPNVPAACAGAIENMVNQNTGAIKQKPVIKLLINTTAGCSISCYEIMNRGAAILSYVDMLENAGYPTEIELYDLGIAGRDLFCSRVIVKQCGQRLDIDRMSFGLAHPSYLRRLGFRLRETHTELKNNFSCGYGTMSNFDDEDLVNLNLGLHVHFPFIQLGFFSSLEKAVEAVKKSIMTQITKQGYELPALAEEGTATH